MNREILLIQTLEGTKVSDFIEETNHHILKTFKDYDTLKEKI